MRKLLLSISIVACLVGCGDKNADSYKGPNITQTPDVGKVESVEVTSEGTGVTPSAAVNDALKTAIAQVNGVSIDSSSVNLDAYVATTANLDLESSEGKDSAKASEVLQSQGFADQIISESNGVVSSFKVTKVTPPYSSPGVYTVAITADIAKFKAPADSGKIKIVIAPLESSQTSFNIGGEQVPAAIILEPIRQQIIDSLTNSGRFLVLDRDFTNEVNDELSMISSGQTSNADMAKIGQALSADIIWVGVVNKLNYDKNVRHLQTSDRDLVGYSGSWSISQKLINLTTRQIMLSDIINGDFPSIGPTTLGASFDESATLSAVQNSIVGKATQAITLKTFPISIVQIDGQTVILSQGEGSLTANARYNVVKLGNEIKDPQTGRLLGNSESDCCEVVITKVTPKLSYGNLENVKIKLEGVDPGVLQVRDEIASEKVVEQEAPAESTPSGSKPKANNSTGSYLKDSDKTPANYDKDW